MHDLAHIYRHCQLTALAVAAILASAGGAAAQVGLGISPMRDEARLAAGGGHSGILARANGILFAAGAGQKKVISTLKPRTTLSDTLPPVTPLAISGMTATPATISFSATDPDSPSVPGNAPASVTWRGTNGFFGSWTLTVQSPSTTFSGCATVPVSAVTVTCTSATVSSFFGSATCRSPFALSTSAQVVAGGNEGLGAGDYAVGLTFTLTDSWRYIAKLSPSCSLTLTYVANLP